MSCQLNSVLPKQRCCRANDSAGRRDLRRPSQRGEIVPGTVLVAVQYRHGMLLAPTNYSKRSPHVWPGHYSTGIVLCDYRSRTSSGIAAPSPLRTALSLHYSKYFQCLLPRGYFKALHICCETLSPPLHNITTSGYGGGVVKTSHVPLKRQKTTNNIKYKEKQGTGI